MRRVAVLLFGFGLMLGVAPVENARAQTPTSGEGAPLVAPKKEKEKGNSKAPDGGASSGEPGAGPLKNPAPGEGTELPAEPGPPMVLGVELHLPPGSDPSGIAEQIAVARNQPLSLRAVRRSIERLYATGRFSDVVARSVPVKSGIRVVFEITPKQRIGLLDVEGEKVLPEQQILSASRLEQGDEYYPELLAQAASRVQALYFRKGYRSAKIGTELHEVEKGTEVLITVDEGPPTRVDGVTIGGNPGLPVPQLVTSLGIPPGGVLDLEALEAGLERLKGVYRDGRFYRARVGDPEVLPGPRGGVMVAVPVNAGPKYGFHFHGNRSFPDRLLEGVTGYDGSETLDDAVMSRMARRIASFYRYRGFHDVHVTPREVRTPNDAQAVVAFDIEEGRPLYVRAVRFEGNTALPSKVLRRILRDQILALEPQPKTDVPPQSDPLGLQGRSRSSAPPSPEPDPLTVYVADAYDHAVRAMREAYREQGYLSASIKVPEIAIDVGHSSGEVRFQIDEGPRAIVREVKYLGLPKDFDPSHTVELRLGEPFRYSAVDDTVRALTRGLGREGFLFAQVKGRQQLSKEGTNAQVVFDIQPGPQVRVGRVILHGLKRSDEKMVRANLVVREGEVLDPEALFESQRNLVLLGIFRTVAVRLIEPDQIEETKDVVVDVRERARLSGELSGGYSLVDGPRVVGDLVYPNLGGTGTSVIGRLKLNYIGASALVISDQQLNADELSGLDGLDGRLNVAVAQPRVYALLPTRIGLRGDFIAERVHRPSFSFARVAGVLGADWTAASWLTVSMQYEAEQEQVRLSDAVRRLVQLGSPELERYRFESGTFSLHSLRPSVTLDFRDDFARPTRGILFNGSAELTQDLGAAFKLLGFGSSDAFSIYTLKVSGNLSGYVPVGPRVVLALSARGGKIFHLTPDSRSIPPKRFFVGGTSSLRGFREDGLIPEDRREALKQDLASCRALAFPRGCTPEADMLNAGYEVPSEGGEIFELVKSELRFPIFGSFDLGVFMEAGNLWLDQTQFDPLKLRYVAGTGVRYATPIGPIALDVGVNLFPDLEVNEPRANLHFSIGLF